MFLFVVCSPQVGIANCNRALVESPIRLCYIVCLPFSAEPLCSKLSCVCTTFPYWIHIGCNANWSIIGITVNNWKEKGRVIVLESSNTTSYKFLASCIVLRKFNSQERSIGTKTCFYIISVQELAKIDLLDLLFQ